MVNVILFVGAFLNSLVIFVFLYSSAHGNKVCYFLITVLSSLDLIVVVVVHSLGILYSLNEFKRKHILVYVKLYGYSSSTLCCSSASVLFEINTDRYLVIAHPFFHLRTVANKKLLFLVGLFWIFIVTPWLLKRYFPVKEKIMSFGTFLLYFLFIIHLSTKILGIGRKKLHLIFNTSAISSFHLNNPFASI